MKKYAIIVAGGSGIRLGGEVPKQFIPIKDKPMLWWSLKAFHDEDSLTDIILVLPEDYISYWQEMSSNLKPADIIPHKVVSGGKSRTESVKKGLAEINHDEAIVAVHDAARPLISRDMIARGWKAAIENKAAVPVVPLVDSIREIHNNSNKMADREKFVIVQTPQVFDVSLLKKAYDQFPSESFSDDAAAVEKTGCRITLFEGEATNRKVTNPGDIEIAQTILDLQDKSFLP